MGAIQLTREGALATVTLSNAGKMNALDVAMWRDLTSTFAALSSDESLRCVIVQGEDGNFAAGADIAEFPSVRASAQQGQHFHDKIVGPAIDAIAACRHPTIAAIEGACAGGGLEIACACDLRIASPSARFGIPIKRLGFALAPNEMRYLLQLAGLAVTLELLLEGRMLDAAEALQKGLLHRIADNPAEEAHATAGRIMEGAPLAAQMNKKLARRLAPQPPLLTPEEEAAAHSLLDTRDYREGVDAFLNRRRPNFTGR